MVRKILLSAALLVLSATLFAQDVYIQSEFEKNEGLLLKWNYDTSIDTTVARIASIVSSDDKVWIIFDAANSFTTSQILQQLNAMGANTANIFFMEGTAENPWLRDYGPVAGYYYDDNSRTRQFVDAQYNPSQFPQADFLTLQLASGFNFNYDAMPLNFEGGNLLLDGIGRGFVGDRVLTENPGLNANQVIQTLYTKLSLNEIIILPSIPECGGGEWSELSRLVKFINSETVLVSQFPPQVPFYQQVEMLADSLSKMYNDVGKQLQVIRIPVAPDENGEYAITNSGILRSYTSSILFNNKVLIPSYNQSADATALEIYRQLFPGYQVFQVAAQNLSVLHGSLYRLAVNIPQENLFRIRHSQHIGMQPYENEIWINAFVDSWNPVDSIQLFYRIHPEATFQALNTYGCCGGNSGFLSGYALSDTISYYLQAYSGNYIQTLPLAAPGGLFTFWFDPYTGTKDLTQNQGISISPNPASDLIFIKGLKPGDLECNYQLFNLNGILLAEGTIASGEGIRLPAKLLNGFYLMKVINSGKTHICKLSLQR